MGLETLFVRRLDWYRRVPSDLTEGSFHGALVSVITLLLAFYLLLTNLAEYLSVTIASEMYVDHLKDNKLRINVDIKFPKLPCPALALDAQDVMGSHELSTGGKLFKEDLDVKGQPVAGGREEVHGNHLGETKFHGLSRHNWNVLHQTDRDQIKKKLLAGEGCRIRGSLEVNRVPGNIHISTQYLGGFGGLGSWESDGIFGSGGLHSRSTSAASPEHNKPKAPAKSFDELTEEQKWKRLQNLDLTHEIVHLSFGDDVDLKWVSDNFASAYGSDETATESTFPRADIGVLAPLDGVKQVCGRKTFKENQGMMMGNWYLPGSSPQLGGEDHVGEQAGGGASSESSQNQTPDTPDLVNTVAQATIFEYYCNVVPTKYEKLKGRDTRRSENNHVHGAGISNEEKNYINEFSRYVYQFTANYNELKNTHAPGIYVRYGIAPVAVRFSEVETGFFTFFVQTLAILGGLFTVAGLLESVLHNGIETMQKKFELGKLT